ncbi:LysR family transcriptional regulator [Ralstonia mojiangensis]|jgi:DNA-binding transcriptional LysR family regulator|uniref:LysR family transcriptional regulator n=1 Tax=Ralstonia mojiangensis TaxID=2953895 RepID=UPI0021B19532|nr:LysR family transcriptional regulator [Ralstonia mojiangensis]MCT7328014.1 LysR family transcriptional regulator [Ralstonia mojiangensis]
MNLRQLRYFCEVVEAGSAALAAKRLFVAPTAVSMQLAQLEEHFGDALFDRSKRPMELTSLGKYFYPRAKELLSQARRLDEEARGIAIGNRGWLGIGFVRSALFSILPATIRRFRASHPDVHLDLVEVLSEYQAEQLQQGRIDVGISRFIGRFEQPTDLSFRVMMREPFLAALPIEHPLAAQDSVSALEFAQLPFILYPKDPKSPFGQQMVAVLRDAGASPLVAYEAIEIHTALALVGAGLGGTLVGQSIAENNRADVAFVRVHDIDESAAVVAMTRKFEESKLVAAFLESWVHVYSDR